MVTNINDLIDKKTINQWDSLSSIYDNVDLVNIIRDIETLCKLERAYLKKRDKKDLSDGAYRELKISRYSKQIDELYNTTTKVYNEKNISEVRYNKQRITVLYRFLINEKKCI